MTDKKRNFFDVKSTGKIFRTIFGFILLLTFVGVTYNSYTADKIGNNFILVGFGYLLDLISAVGLNALVILVVYWVLEYLNIVGKNGMKININKNILLMSATALMLAGLFYWFEWRPSQIKKECTNKTQDKIKGTDAKTSFVRAYYEMCLHKKGL